MAARSSDLNLQDFLRCFTPKPSNARNARRDLLPPNPAIWKLYHLDKYRALACVKAYFQQVFGCTPEARVTKEPFPMPLGALRLEMRGGGQRMVLWMLPGGQFLRFPPKAR